MNERVAIFVSFCEVSVHRYVLVLNVDVDVTSFRFFKPDLSTPDADNLLLFDLRHLV